MNIEQILNIVGKGFITGLIFANITILTGWGIRQLIIFFKNLIYGGF